MKNLNTIIFNPDLTVSSQTEKPIQAFSSYQNIIRVIVPFGTEYVPFGIFHATNATDDVAVPSQFILMLPAGTVDVGGENYFVYEQKVPEAIVASLRATKIEFVLSLWAKADDFIGVQRYDETAQGYNTTTYIAAQLLQDFPNAEEDEYVRVFNTETDWEFNGTAWVNTTDVFETVLEDSRSEIIEFALYRGKATGKPTHKPNNTEALIDAINLKVSKTGDTMTGQLQFANAALTRLIMGNNNITTDAGINATTFANGGNSSDAVKFSNFAALFDVSVATPAGGQTWITTVAAALAAKFAGILSEAELNAIYFRRDGTVSMSGNLNVGGNQITNVGNVDGVDISAFKSTTDSHIGATNNPHSVSAAQTGAYTTAQTNTLLDGKAAASHTHPISEVTNLQTTLNTLAGNISALSGAFIFRGVVSNTTAQVTADTGLLTTRIDELLDRQPQTGDVLKDSEGGEWYYDGGAWRFVGQSFVDLTPYLTTDNANNTFETIANIGNRTYTEDNVVTDAQSITASIDALDIEIETKVDKEAGKGLSANDFTTTLQNKLNGIADGAEVNVQANWTEADTQSDAFILNVPSTFPPSSHTHAISEVTNLETELSGKEPTFTKNTAFNKDFGNTAGTVTEGNDARLSDARTPLSHTHAISEVTNLQAALDSKPTIDSVTGKIPASVIPLQFEDVIQGFLDDGVFYEEVGLVTPIVGEQGKLYIDIPTNRLFRFDGAAYVVIIDADAINSLNDIPGVNLVSVGNNEALVFNSTSGNWENQAIPRTVTALEDTTITSATNGQVLTWNGTAWVNAAIPTQALNDLTDVVVTTPVANHLLVHNGTNFVNQAGSSSLVGLNNVQNYGIATQAEAEAGTSDEKYMTPLKTAQAIAELAEHENITAATSVDNSGNNVIQDVTLDSNGHVTGLVSKEITSVANATVADTVDNANSANNLTFWTGTQNDYDNLTPDANTLYFVTE